MVSRKRASRVLVGAALVAAMVVPALAFGPGPEGPALTRMRDRTKIDFAGPWRLSDPIYYLPDVIAARRGEDPAPVDNSIPVIYESTGDVSAIDGKQSAANARTTRVAVGSFGSQPLSSFGGAAASAAPRASDLRSKLSEVQRALDLD